MILLKIKETGIDKDSEFSLRILVVNVILFHLVFFSFLIILATSGVVLGNRWIRFGCAAEWYLR